MKTSVYFISYSYIGHNVRGFGNCEIKIVGGMSDAMINIRTIEDQISSTMGNITTTILWYTLLRTEETPK